MARRHKRRRGIVILVVLSLLVLFTLLVATYVIVAGQYRDAAINSSQQELLGVDPQKDLDKAFNPLLRGSPLAGSSIRFHELLRDMYGEDGFTGRLAFNTNSYHAYVNDPAALAPATPPLLPPRSLGQHFSNGQFMDLVMNVTATPLYSTDGTPLFTVNPNPPPPPPYDNDISEVSGYYNGCVLTITEGAAQGLSTRIIGYSHHTVVDTSTNPHTSYIWAILRVLAFKDDNGNAISPAQLEGKAFVVNGRPFSGTGFGFNPTAAAAEPKLNMAYFTALGNTGLELALLPNYAFLSPGLDLTDPNNPVPVDNVANLLRGGSDEGYDAPDFQNMAMAIVQTRPNGTTIDRMPSFHRPALVRYWRNREQTLWQNDLTNDFKRLFIFRPIEPNFDGSNPDYKPPPIDTSVNPPVVSLAQSWYETGPWDVDNDGDGIRDSIWVDLGMPVQTAPDGRKYKPLFAIMCRDLDGLLNVNAHGRIPVYSRVPASLYPSYPFHPTQHLNDGNDPCRLYRKGLGYGPPEIDLLWTGIAYDPALTAAQNLAKVVSLMSSRYGPDGVPGFAGLDPLARIRFFEEPQNYFLGTVGRTSYSSPPDLRAELAFGANLLGQPIFEPLPIPPAANAVTEARAESAFEMNLVEGSVGDDPYTPAEYERLARRFDHDRHMLSNRLAGITKPLLVTTDSFDVPMPSISAPPELLNYIRTRPFLSAHNTIDLLTARLQRGWEALPTSGRIPTAILNTQLVRMLSVDVAKGLRFDLNRPIGNALDGSVFDGTIRPGDAVHQGVGIVDEAALPTTNTELGTEQLYFGKNAVGRPEFNSVGMWQNNGFFEYWPDLDNNNALDDLDGDGEGNGDATNPVDADDVALARTLGKLLARQRYARHLYVLMMTLIDRNFVVNEDVNGSGVPPDRDDTAYMVAQWAINVVDFRDADSIMTPFEFDTRPFEFYASEFDPADPDKIINTWNVDGVVNGYLGMVSGDDGAANTQRGLVWGCERPELLLTEAMGFHARRTRDAATDTAGATHATTTPAPNTDPDYDQEHLPFATAFVEMYNPWAGIDTNRTPPAEMYGNTGVHLHRTTPSGNPVWRLLIINQNDVASIANNSFDPDLNSGAIVADRAVYFISQTAIDNGQAVLPAVGDAHGHRQYYTDLNVPPIIGPGQHAVIGGGYQNGVEWVSPVGDINPSDPDAGSANAQRIVLAPNTGEVRVYPGTVDRATGNPMPHTTAQALVIVPNRSTIDAANTQVRTAFSVSEPRAGYPISVAGGAALFNESNNPATHVPYSYTGMYESAGLGTSLPYDTPLDKEATDFVTQVAQRDGTNRTFCRVYLQRLANPLQDHNAQINPYRTIDSIPMDLTVFNGREAFPSGASDPDVANPNVAVEFSCIQRGDADPPDTLRLWPQEPARGTTGPTPPQPTQSTHANSVMYFDYVLQNAPLNAPPTTPPIPQRPGHSLGFRNRGYSIPPTYQTPPTDAAFPWLVWNNRPFVSAYELMHVPRYSAWNLLKTNHFSLPSGSSPYNGNNPQYGYTLNFFHTSTTSGTAPHYYRIFDYVTVPSRFVGTDTVLNPDFFGKTANFAQPSFSGFTQPNLASLGLLPPFNRISKYRVPGLVNINTVPHATVWNAIRGPHVQVTNDPTGTPPYDWINPQADYTKTGPDYSVVFNSRTGNGGSLGIPTMFANPYRPMGARNLVPLASLRPSEDIDVTIMRGSAANPQMQIAPTPDSDLARHTRNSFFRYELMHRLGNMVTTRSNVYAIWITVGYFEMEPNNIGNQVVYDRHHPEGLRVGQEIGIDTGEIQRHRAFYMIDRTIPVAFQPGENHNVDKCVLLRRFIE